MLRVIKLIICSALILSLAACKEEEGGGGGSVAPIDATSCRGEWTVKDENGLVRARFEQWWHRSMGKCLTDNRPLTQFETSLNKRFDHGVTCTPQTDLPSMWLKSANGYYTYRNDRVFIELDASTGQARRLIIGETADRKPSFKREVFCYYLRTDIETEPVNPTDYGAMILFDVSLGASSDIFHPMEIYGYNLNGNDLSLTMKSDNSGVGWTWCPTTTPIGFCDYLRNGNEMYYPTDPDAATQAQLTAAALLIRNEHPYVKVTEDEFNSKWNNPAPSAIEMGTTAFVEAGGKWKYTLSPYFDEPFFVGQAWKKYLKKDPDWPFMPDVAWASSSSTRLICYSTKKQIVLSDGSKAWINGEACYDSDGVYTFTQQ